MIFGISPAPNTRSPAGSADGLSLGLDALGLTAGQLTPIRFDLGHTRHGAAVDANAGRLATLGAGAGDGG